MEGSLKLIVLLPLLLIAHSGDFDGSESQRLHQQLQPGKETWRTNPWQISLLDARALAAAEKKPIFIWAMDGHPLGCT